ncbi:MAG TPA: HNH endonuclease signature motif containing protein, partial [Streptosporangiaceae bacterium]|nr:HNH endonuclease signature motif containing protein [Streptosporangiaceae bacterium]
HSAGGPGKPTRSNPGRAPRSDPTIIPRSQGGPTSLTNLLLLCTFHHLIAVHRWGWGIVLLPDGAVTATSPDRSRILRSHGPPSRAA